MPLAQLTILAASLLGWSDTITIQPSRGDRSSGLQRSIAGLDRPATARWKRSGDSISTRNIATTSTRPFSISKNTPSAAPSPSWSTPWPSFPGSKANASIAGGSPQAIDRFLDAAAYAHDYLFGTEPELADGRGRSDPRFRLACEIYNAGVERLIRAALTKGQIQLQNGEAIPFKVHGREQSLRIVLQDSPWHQADIHKILLTSDFEVTGLNKDLYQYGLGVPLIAVRETETQEGRALAGRAFLPRRDGLSPDRLPGAELAAQRPQRRHQGSPRMHPRSSSTRSRHSTSAKPPTRSTSRSI